MSRPGKIWFRKDVGWWMVTLGPKKVRLAQGRSNRKEAERKFHELKAVQARPPDLSDSRVADVIESFLAWSRSHLSSETNRNLVWYGQQFAEFRGYLRATDLKPIHVTEFVDQHQWNPTTERNARRAIYRAFSWAVQEGLLAIHPLHGMRCPGALTRQRAMTDEEFRALLRGSKHNFKILLYTLRATGCRPKEARTLTWDQVREDRWILPLHKTVGKTHRPRVVYLTPPMQKLMAVLRRRAQKRGVASGPVFLNDRGVAWTGEAITQRIKRLKQKLNLAPDLSSYLARHAFGTGAILNGVNVMSVAQLMGHTSLEMIQRVYVHLAGQDEHLHQAAQQATQSLASARPRPTAPRSDAGNAPVPPAAAAASSPATVP